MTTWDPRHWTSARLGDASAGRLARAATAAGILRADVLDLLLLSFVDEEDLVRRLRDQRQITEVARGSMRRVK